MIAAIAPLLQQRLLRVVLVAAPGLMAAVAIVIALESNLAMAIVLNVASGVLLSSVLFIAVSLAAKKVADERIGLVRAAEQGFWRARIDLTAIEHEESGLYTDWYFRLRLQEEIDRSRRHEMNLSLLTIKPMAVHQDSEVQSTAAWFGDKVRSRLRRSDIAALLHDGVLVIAMPNTGRRSATTAKRRIEKDLAQAEPTLTIACFPEDGEDAETLLKTAGGAPIAEYESTAA